ncbi:hypothetical protein TRIUR3_25103 [Triticum urartu]|uniref:Spt5 KOW domain-containing protein n=1 Tax=Triticum urartu TaxID=4572 RepID=M7YD90_TRIUA|nr:hypothetical protein TRIUR3_25103 [Triticum urartu]
MGGGESEADNFIDDSAIEDDDEDEEDDGGSRPRKKGGGGVRGFFDEEAQVDEDEEEEDEGEGEDAEKEAHVKEVVDVDNVRQREGRVVAKKKTFVPPPRFFNIDEARGTPSVPKDNWEDGNPDTWGSSPAYQVMKDLVWSGKCLGYVSWRASLASKMSM